MTTVDALVTQPLTDGENMNLDRNMWDENTQVRINNRKPEIDSAQANAHYQELMTVECSCGTVRADQLDLCSNCRSFNIGSFRVSDEAFQFMNSKELTKEVTWFHATTHENWGTDIITSGLSVHLGTKETALALMQARRGSKTTPFTFDLYEVSIDEESTVSNVVCPDLVNAWSSDAWELVELTGCDFVRYVNNYENAGSISLIGDSANITIQKQSMMSIDADGNLCYPEEDDFDVFLEMFRKNQSQLAGLK